MANWKPDKNTKAKINKKLKDAKLKERIERTIKRWGEKQKPKDADKSQLVPAESHHKLQSLTRMW